MDTWMSDSDEEVDVRPATLHDVQRLAELTSTLGYPVEAADLRPRVERTLVRDDTALYVAEAVTGEVVGWILGAEQETFEMGRRCEILGLVVAETGRRRGTGSRLVAAIEAWGRSRGLGWILVRSNITRPESHPFYERVGYGRVKTQHVYSKPLAHGRASEGVR
jgi:ribosomal protein S18 acetylase RimI-like enzyme